MTQPAKIDLYQWQMPPDANLSHITKSLRPLAVPVTALYQDPANARTGHDLDKLTASLQRYKQRKPIVVNVSEGNKVEAGNGTLAAANELGWKYIAAVLVEDDPTTAAGYGIADNRIAELSRWNYDTLGALLNSIDPDMELETGFTAEEIANLDNWAKAQAEGRDLADELFSSYDDEYEGEPEELEDSEPEIDRADELCEIWGVAPGQVWRLPSRVEGQEHRIICGDCTDEETVRSLMQGERPESLMMVTDPPYGVEYDPQWRAEVGVNKNRWKMGRVENDDRADWSEAWALFESIGGTIAYVYHAGLMSAIVVDSLKACGFEPRAQIVWAKDRMALSRGDYHWQHEPCYYAVLKGNPGLRTDDRTQTTLWVIPARDDGGHGHGTQKPVECMARPIRNHHVRFVYEPFSGSGTTIIAAENLSRECRAIEISPAYVAVALQRYLDAFDITPELVSESK